MTGAGGRLLLRALSYTLATITAVRPGSLADPTPCPDWDLRALLLHANDSLITLHTALTLHRISRCQPEVAPAVDPVANCRHNGAALAAELVRAEQPDELIAVGGFPLDSNIVANTGAVEIAVHGWDVARACRYDRPIPHALAVELLTVSRLLVGRTDRQPMFAPSVHVPSSAAAGDRLAAFLGRTVSGDRC
jgi:uncharacterized protein (TIGR03086 family)